MIIDRFEAHIKLVPRFECHDCRKKQSGSTVRLTLWGNDTESLHRQIDRANVHSHHMPEGWSYNGTYHCEKCTK